MKYKSGEKIKLGDRIVFDKSTKPGIVHAIVETKEEKQQWCVEENGLLVESKPLGLIFLPNNKLDPVILVSRMPSLIEIKNFLKEKANSS